MEKPLSIEYGKEQFWQAVETLATGAATAAEIAARGKQVGAK